MKFTKKSTFVIAALMAAVASLTACKEREPVQKTADESRAEVLANSDKNTKLQALMESQRSTALSNAQANAASYFATNPRFDTGFKIVAHTDDYISPACPQGSGWATVKFMKVIGKEIEKYTAYCNTASGSVGCYIEADFQKGPYARQATACDANLPYPLKPIAGR